jgi:hypothetical protein
MDAVGDFRLSITRALGDQLDDALSQLTPAALDAENIAQLQSRPGVYELFLQGRLVYVGKADTSIPTRLRQHHRKISGRRNIDVEQMSYVAMYVDEDLSAVAPETLLISRQKALGSAEWNFNGFGNKDPGRQRDTSAIAANHFDAIYPINLDVAFEQFSVGEHAVADVMATLKASAPFLLRYAPLPQEMADLPIRIERTGHSLDDLLSKIASVVPEWQITALPGYVIAYREDREYPMAQRTYRYESS